MEEYLWHWESTKDWIISRNQGNLESMVAGPYIRLVYMISPWLWEGQKSKNLAKLVSEVETFSDRKIQESPPI